MRDGTTSDSRWLINPASLMMMKRGSQIAVSGTIIQRTEKATKRRRQRWEICEIANPALEAMTTVIGTTNLPSLMAFHSSQLYSRNVGALLLHLAPNGELVLDWEDEITAGACVTREGAGA